MTTAPGNELGRNDRAEPAPATLAETIDRLVEAPVLVFGSPPPAGRDLDLLARPVELDALAAWLAANGFRERGGEWVRFHECTADSLDLVPVSAWGLPDASVEELFADARPIDGFERLVRPAPPHLLLAHARRLAEGDGRLSAKHRARLEAAIAEDPSAWDAARASASAWRAEHALTTLARAYRSNGRASRAERARALADWPYAQGRTRRRALVRGWLEARRAEHRQPGRLISFSGLDGAGKSSQAEALRDTLERLGWQATIQWTRLEWTTLWENRWLGILGWPARASLGVWARARPARTDEGGKVEPLSTAELRQRSALISNVWVTIIAVAHGLAQRRETRPHLRTGAIVLCDRYTLDSAAQLRFRYGAAHAYSRQIKLLARLSPTPFRSYFMDVPAETAYGRKAEQYSLDDLTRQAAIYREEAPRLGARRLDGERARDELCREIAEEIWQALRDG
jgi:thymidylate kinase